MREKVTFEERVQVQLDKDEAKPVESRDGSTEYMRVLDNDQRIMFAPAALESAIKASGARAGDVIQIDKIKAGRNWHWEVAIVTAQPPAAARRTVPPEAPQRATPPPTAHPPITNEAIQMTTAFAAAITAAGEAEAIAAAQGIRDFHLTSSDIRSIAATIYIQRAEGGPR